VSFSILFFERVVIIRQPKAPGNEVLRDFFTSHEFYAKGIDNDLKMLQGKFYQSN
jgi:hypothetical protein